MENKSGYISGAAWRPLLTDRRVAGGRPVSRDGGSQSMVRAGDMHLDTLLERATLNRWTTCCTAALVADAAYERLLVALAGHLRRTSERG